MLSMVLMSHRPARAAERAPEGAFPDRYETILRKLWLNRGKIHRLGQRSGLSQQ
jgi:hypothetical protein